MSISHEERMVALLQNAVQPTSNKEEVLQQLANVINYLVLHDFARLIRILYRVDIEENKLKKLLNDYPKADAGILIANLLIERQLQKEQSRKLFSNHNYDIPEEDRWQ